ncbi:twin-arginine translocation signal domain-containing protein [Rhizobium leguminosarum]|uniref:twin-arginine translocation signal domain-containing protein n=1 Tax=Rhizobium leguminosarum TaxID=384 RepID=UPI0039658609
MRLKAVNDSRRNRAYACLSLARTLQASATGSARLPPSGAPTSRQDVTLCRNLFCSIRPRPLFVVRSSVLMPIIQTRRRFLAGAATVGAAGVVGLPESLQAKPLETTSVRLPTGASSAS